MGFEVSLMVEATHTNVGVALELTIPYSPLEQRTAEDPARRCAHLIVISLLAAIPKEPPYGHGGGCRPCHYGHARWRVALH
jgi:hypothetical protein